MITAKIMGMNQVMDFDTGIQATYLVLTLPNGKTCQALIEEDDAAEVVKAFFENGGASSRPSVPTPPPQRSRQPAQEHASSEFSAVQTDDGAAAYVFGDPSPSETPAPTAPPPLTQVNGTRPRLVGKDDAGNPILEYPNGAPTDMVPASAGGDEDGVAQL